MTLKGKDTGVYKIEMNCNILKQEYIETYDYERKCQALCCTIR
jgi:hypothetical protein